MRRSVLYVPKVLAFWLAIGAFIPGLLHAQAIFTDDFNYTCCGGALTAQGGGWTSINSGTSVNMTSGLTYAGYANSGIGYGIELLNSGQGAEHPASAVVGTIYSAFLFQASAATSGGLVMNFNGNGAGSFLSSGFAVSVSGGLKFGLSNSGSISLAPTARNFGETYLIIIQYNASSKQYSLFVDPIINAAQPAADLTITHAGSSPTNITTVRFYQSIAGSDFIVDGVRVATSWSDATSGTGGSSGSILINESFNYPNGDDIGLHGWSNFVCCNPINVKTPGLTYPGFGGIGNSVQLQIGTTAYYKPFSSVSSGVIYVSFLLNSTNSSSNNTSSMLNFYSSGGPGQFNQNEGFILDNNNLSIKYGAASGAVDNGPFISNGTTTLVVLGYDISAGLFSLYNSPPVGGISPPAPARTDAASNMPAFVDGISIINPNNGSTVNFDEIRVSTNWADVVAVQEPPDQPVGLFLTGTTSTTINGIFAPAASAPTGYVVFRGTGIYPVTQPVDNLSYTVGTTIGDATVVSSGSSTTFTDNNSTLPGTTYYYSVYAYNSYNGAYNYNLNAPLQGFEATEPVAPPSALVFSNLTATSVDLTYTPPVGVVDGYLVLRSTSTNAAPTDGVSYTSGNSIGASTVAYVGPLVTFSDTGLPPNQTYAYNIYAYAGSGNGINYTSVSLAGTVTLPPANQPTGISFSARTTSSMTVSFTAAVGSPQSYLLIYKSGSSPTNGAPVDGTTYGIGNSLGGGTVGGISSGGAPISVTGLLAGTQYFFDIYSFNGSGTNTNYLEGVTPLEGSAYTLANEPTGQPTVLTFSALTPTGFNGAFLAASPVPSGYIGLRRSGSAVADVPVDGTLYSVGNSIGTSTVAFIGSPITFSESTLTPATTYYYKVFSYGQAVDPSTVNYFTGGTPLTNNQSTIATPPATQASNIVFSGVTDTQMTLSWTNGNGARRTVLAHAGATVNANPANATSYTANAAFGAGTQIGVGNYVVYDGTGSSVTVGGLTAATVYYYEVYEYNGSGVTAGYNTTTAANNPASQTSLATPPSTQASTILFSGLSPTQLTLTWTSGNGARRVVLAHAGAAVNSNPANSTTYTANAAFGSGTQIGVGNYVVYDGIGNSVTVTGLSASTVYNFQVFEYNGTTATINYLTSTAAGNPGAQTTLGAAVVTQATNILFSGMTTTSMTLNWTNGSGANRLVLAHSGAAVNSNPVSGTTYAANTSFGSGTQIGVGNYVVYDGSGTSVTITNLTATTTFYFEVYEYNGTAGAQNYLTTTAAGNPANQATLTGPPTIQATNIVFSALSNNQITLTWTSGNGANRVVLAHAGSAVNANPANATTYTASATFGSGTQIGTGNYVVYNGAGNTVTVAGLTNSTVYFFEVFEFNGAGATTNYLTSAAGGNPNNVSTVANPPTVQASNANFSNISNNSMTVGWTNGNGTSRIVVAHAGAAVNSNPVNGVGYVAAANFGSGSQIGTGNYVVYDGSGTSVSVTGMSAATAYYFEVYEYSGSGVTANYLTTAAVNNPANQTTLAAPATTQSTNILFSAISNTQMTLTWTSGNGARRVVLGHASAAVNANPVNATTYTANAAFGSGTQIGVGNFVVYDGTGNSQTVTGLSASTVYNFQVFEYNGTTTTINYLTAAAAGNPAGQTTFAASPGTQATSLTFPNGNITNSQALINWTNGNGSKRIVVAHAGAPVDSNPLDGVAYTANAAFGSGTQIGTGNYVVYNGSGNSVTVSSLSASTTYNFEVFEYNGSGADNNFNTTTASGNPNQVLTLTNAPVANAATSILETSFTANWSAVTGSTGYFIDVSTDNFSTFVPNFNNLAVGATSVSVTGLTGGTTYQYQIRAGNATGPSANSATIIVLTVPAAPTVISPTAITDQSFTANWNASPGTVDAYFVDVATDAGFTSMVSGFGNKQVTAPNTALVVNGLAVAAGTTYYYQVRAKNSSGTSVNSSPVAQVLTAPPPPTNVAIPDNFRGSDGTSFRVTWTAAPGATSYEVDVFDLDNGAAPVYLSLPSAGTLLQVTGLSPSTAYQVVVRSVNSSGVSGNSSPAANVTLDSNGGTAYTPPSISVQDNQNSNTQVAAVIHDGKAPYSVVFNHRKISESSFVMEPPASVPNLSSPFQVTIDESFLDELGVEYYFTVTDQLNNTSQSTSSYVYRQVSNASLSNSASFTSGGTLESYRMFSIPLELASNRIEDIFQPVIAQYGGIDKTKWRLVRYKGGQNIDYGAGLTTIDKGEGYWFNSLDAPAALNVSGTAIAAHQGLDFALALDQGFTQIGNPFTFDVSWSDVLAANGNPSGVSTLKIYSPTTTSFAESDKLSAWGGGFVHSDVATSIKIPVTVQHASRVARQPVIAKGPIDGLQWLVPLTIHQGVATNPLGGFGMHPEANAGYDRFDDFTVPRFASYLELNSYHPEYHTHRFSRDIVPTASQHQWEFEVESNGAGEGEMTWDNLALGTNDAQLLLYDVAANAFIDMKKEGNYHFELAEKRTFKIFFAVDDQAVVSDINILGKGFPNPSPKEVTFPFIIGKAQTEVSLEVFDMMGRRVRQVLHGHFDPGYFEAQWDGNDDQLGRAPQGVYIYRFVCTNTPAQSGRIVLK